MIPDEIAYCLSITVTDDLLDVLTHSFELFELFELPDYEEEFTNILMLSSQMSIDELHDNFMTKINSNLDFIITAHTIKLVPDVTIIQKNELLDALHLVQDLDSYESMLALLESDTSDVEVIAEILSELCNLTSMEILSMLDDVDSELITNIKKYAYQQEETLLETKPDTDLNTKVCNKLKIFKEFCKEYITLGIFLIDNNVLTALPLNEYTKYTADVFKDKSPKDLAYHIYSLMLLSCDNYENPLLGFKQHADTFINDLKELSLVEVEITRLDGEFNKYIITRDMGNNNE